jgi:hypothetical protein
MISDILFSAADEIKCYLNAPEFQAAYDGETRKQIEALVAEMKRLQDVLDAVPEDA